MSSIDSPPLAPAPPALRLLDQVRARIRVKHYSIRTEETYVDWIRRFVLHFGKRHARELALLFLCCEVQELLGPADVSTTMIYTHVLNEGGRGVPAPEYLTKILDQNYNT